ncbi:MAG TPA: hypothetical protein VNP98_17040 [Chthoniobacterales bacterium]|nr:hypothetical protein [Chthoniobacterales bacterium]
MVEALVPRQTSVLGEALGVDKHHLENQRELGVDGKAIALEEVVRFGQLHNDSRDS